MFRLTRARRVDLRFKPGRRSESVEVTAEAPQLEDRPRRRLDRIRLQIHCGPSGAESELHELRAPDSRHAKTWLVPRRDREPAGRRPDFRQRPAFQRNRISSWMVLTIRIPSSASSLLTPTWTRLPKPKSAPRISTLSSARPSLAWSRCRRNRAAMSRTAAPSTSVAPMRPKHEIHLRNGRQARRWTGHPIPSTRWQQFGGSLGGAPIKDKLFVFGDFQGTRQASGQTNQITVPTATVLQSCNPATNVTSSTPGFCNLSDLNTESRPPATAPADRCMTQRQALVMGRVEQPFAGNLIPINRISPAAGKILALFPQPNTCR